MKKTTVIKGIVIIIGAIVSFLFMRFFPVVAISIIAICALIFGSVVGGAIGLISTLILNILNFSQGFSLWTIVAIAGIFILIHGFYGFILGKIFEAKVKNINKKNLKFGIFILSAMLLYFVINILFGIINYFLNSDIYTFSDYISINIKNFLFSSLVVGIIILITIIIYHKVFKGKIPFFEKDEIMEKSKPELIKSIVGIAALLLCLLFFILPLVQGTDGGYSLFGVELSSGSKGLTATGWQIATGTGELFDRTDDSAYQVIFFLLIVPIVLLILAFAKRSFIVLGIVSAAGLLCKIIFYIVVESLGHEGGFTATAYSWLVTALYIGLCAFTFYNWVKLEKNSGNLIVQKAEMTKKCPFCANDIKQEAIVCQFCGRDLPNGGNNS